MQPLQTTEGIVLAGDIEDLKDIIIEKCGYEVYDFIKCEDTGLIDDLRSQIDDWESDFNDSENKSTELEIRLKEAEERIKELEKELEQLKHDPIIIPIELLKKPIDLDDLDDEECIPF